MEIIMKVNLKMKKNMDMAFLKIKMARKCMQEIGSMICFGVLADKLITKVKKLMDLSTLIIFNN
jgi:hypothetical protein